MMLMRECAWQVGIVPCQRSVSQGIGSEAIATRWTRHRLIIEQEQKLP